MGSGGFRYDQIGRTYAATRREDPVVAAQVWASIGEVGSIVNIGAGTGSYEPTGCQVTAVEPSPEMLRQRHGRSRLVVRARAEQLPFPDRSFDVAFAILTVHHWDDAAAGLAEMRRVADRQVVLYFEPLHTHGFWALEYFPEALSVASEQDPPGESQIGDALDVTRIEAVEVPHDCQDGFGIAFWARPEAYLDPTVQAGMSWMALQPARALAEGSRRLAEDLRSGAWDERFGHLRHKRSFDGGYRLAIAGE